MMRGSIRYRDVVLPLVVMVFGLASTGLAYRLLKSDTRARYESDFKTAAAWRAESVSDAFSGLVDELDSIGRFFENSTSISGDEFTRFATSGVSSDRFSVIMWAVPANGSEWIDPAGMVELEAFYFVPNLQPRMELSAVLGTTELRVAVAKAATSGRTAASSITELPWTRPQPAVAVCRPVFGAADDSGARRVGIVMGLVCISSVAERAILSSEPLGLPTSIHDAGTGPSSGAPSYAHSPRIGRPVESGHRNAGLVYSQSVGFADRTWTVEVRPSTAYGAAEDRSAAYFAVAGIVASIALGALVLSLARGKSRAEAVADAKSGEFELFFTTSLDLFALAGVDGTFKRLNRQWESALGYAIEELQGQRFIDFVHPDDRAATSEAVLALSTGVEVVGFVNRYRAKDGSYRSIEWRSTISADRNTIFAAARDITDRVSVEEVLRRSLQEKEALLKEVHHRVKNNMQVISSLLDLEAMKSDEPRFAAAAKEAQGRIRSMAMVHEQLYKQDSATAVDLGSYIKELAERVVEEHSGGPVSLSVEADTVLLDLDTAIPCGLAVNELLTNAFKYACKGREAVISVTAALGSGICAILVEDDGPGLPGGALERSLGGQTLGLSLVSGLAQQLHGELIVLPGSGARFELRFPYKAEPRPSL